MQSRLNPYLNFTNSASEAMDFYHSVFGGKLDKSTFGENHMTEDPAEADLIMHAMLTADNGIVLMAADAPASMAAQQHPNGSLSLSGDNEAELRGYWDKLVDGGSVTYPLEKAPWGDIFGMCVDMFGVNWLVNISGPAAADS